MKHINLFLFFLIFLFSGQSLFCMKKIFIKKKKNRTVVPCGSTKVEGFEGQSTSDYLFLPDPTEEELTCWQKFCCGYTFDEFKNFFSNGGLGAIIALFSSSKRNRRFNLYKNNIVSDPKCGLEVDEKNK